MDSRFLFAKAFATVVFISLAASASAQFSFDSAATPDAGTLEVRTNYLPQTVAPGGGGLGAVWDFREAGIGSTYTRQWLPASEETGSSDFNGTQLAGPHFSIAQPKGFGPFGNPLDYGTPFLRRTQDDLLCEGMYFERDTISPSPFVKVILLEQASSMSLPEVIAPFDFSMPLALIGTQGSNSFTQAWKALLTTPNYSDTMLVKRDVSLSFDADGQGILRTPQGTTVNTFRIRTDVTERDSILLRDSSGNYTWQPSMGSIAQTTVQTKYDWHTASRWQVMTATEENGQIIEASFSGRPTSRFVLDTTQIGYAENLGIVSIPCHWLYPDTVPTEVRVQAVSNGTAALGPDLALLTDTLFFAAGQPVDSIRLHIFDDSLDEGQESIRLEINPFDYPTGAPDTVLVTIQDNELIGYSWAQSGRLHGESAQNYSVGLALKAAPEDTSQFVVRAVGGTPPADTLDDYVFVGPDTVSITPNQMSASVIYQIREDMVAEGYERFRLVASPLTAGFESHFPDTFTVTIEDDDFRPTANFTFEDTSVFEGIRTLEATVSLNAPALSPLSVSYATEQGTATASADFIPVGGSLDFQPGDQAKSIVIDIVNDTINEGAEGFLLRLTSVSGIGQLGERDTLSIVVTDNDPSNRLLAAQAKQLSIYPNPVYSDRVSIQGLTPELTASVQSVSIVDMTGRQLQASMMETGKHEVSINCENVPRGVYAIRLHLHSGHAVSVGRLVRQ